MHLSIRSLVLAAIVAGAQGAVAEPAFSQDAQSPAANLSAREIFYLADEAPPPAKTKPAQGTPHKTSHTKPPMSGTQSAQAPDASAYHDNTGPNGDQLTSGQVHLASVTDRQYPPLGMRYAMYRLADGTKEAVDTDKVFHSNDHIQFTVDVSAPGYLYVVSRGSSGKWSTLFPAADADATANLVQPRRSYTFPPGQVITFAEPAGKEELFLFLSRQPVRNTEDLMLRMSGSNKSTPASQQAPDRLAHSNVVEAFNRMDDSQIGVLRTAYSRDLIVEKVNTETSAAPVAPVAQAPAKDTSVYVVNPSAGADAHVVADVIFRHE
jgi:hypothetical protein